jgi:S1-C subfamily serine protease
MRLTGPEFESLHDALLDAFVSYDELGTMLRRTDWKIQAIAAPDALPAVITKVIEYAESRDRVQELIAAARAEVPTNALLFNLSAAIGLVPSGVPPADLTPEQALPRVSARLERLVDPQRGIADLGSFYARIGELMRQVCAVELGDDYGTGFLIGPRTILTNYHVVERAIDGGFDPAAIRVRFDFQRLRDGLTTNAGVVHELAAGADWIVAKARYSESDKQAYNETSLPTDGELDYAVLQTRDEVGREVSSGLDGVERGWVEPRASAYGFPTGSFLLIVQHPCHDPISFDSATDAVIRVNPNGTRVHYTPNTMPGSSGSPVLDRKLELVALHHGGEPGSPDVWLPCNKQTTPASYNEGVPIARIQAHLADQGLSWVFEGTG